MFTYLAFAALDGGDCLVPASVISEMLAYLEKSDVIIRAILTEDSKGFVKMSSEYRQSVYQGVIRRLC